MNRNSMRALVAGIAVVLLLVVFVPVSSTLRAESDAGNAVAQSLIRLEVFPERIRLDRAGSSALVVVTGHYQNGMTRDLSRAAELEVSGPQAALSPGRDGDALTIGAKQDGECTLIVRIGDQSSQVPIEVKNQSAPSRVSFQFDTLAALSKHNCNMGACHGSPSGKGGFRLSLRAYDPALDIETLVREAFTRRVDLYEPERSLLLRKPLMEVTHGGGQRLKKSDLGYTVLRDWIEQGCQPDAADAPHCVRLEVYPRSRVLSSPKEQQQVIGLAHFSDGTVRDVTPLAVFSSSDEAVATVSDGGLATASDRGQTAILVRYLDKIETCSLTVLKETPGFQWPEAPEHNYVDTHVFAKLRQLQIAPSDLATDDEFMRRAYLDVIGRLPEPEETRAFLADNNPLKRAALVDRLLERPEYADFWALKWGDLLRIRNSKVTNLGVHKFRHWLTSAMRDNIPYDRFVRDLLTSGGSTLANPPANYFRTSVDTNDCTETTSQVFLGVRIQCAKCHNHPFERWSQDNYYGIGAFFNRVQRKPGDHPDEQVIFVSRSGEVTQPRTGRQMKPWLPLEGHAEVDEDRDRREALVEWLVRPHNPFFAKVEVNRIWSHLLGRGVVEPVDDFRDSNPPASAELLQALADDFVDHKFDRKHIIRTILNSRTYQLSARRNAFNESDTKNFSHAQTRLLSAEQLLDAVCHVTGVNEKFAGLPAGTRATQLPSPDVESEFLKVFGQPARETACQCERSTDSNLSQALQMINGPLVHSKVRDAGNRLRKLAEAGKTDSEIVGELYVAAYCRTPTKAELATAQRHIERTGDRMRALEDICWAVLNTNEFLFQH